MEKRGSFGNVEDKEAESGDGEGELGFSRKWRWVKREREDKWRKDSEPTTREREVMMKVEFISATCKCRYCDQFLWNAYKCLFLAPNTPRRSSLFSSSSSRSSFNSSQTQTFSISLLLYSDASFIPILPNPLSLSHTHTQKWQLIGKLWTNSFSKSSILWRNKYCFWAFWLFAWLLDLGYVLNLNLWIWMLWFVLCCGACLVGGKTEESYAGFWFLRNGIGIFCSIFLLKQRMIEEPLN